MIAWDPRPAVCVVIASGGYPGAYKKDVPIRINKAVGLGVGNATGSQPDFFRINSSIAIENARDQVIVTDVGEQ